MAKEYNSKGKNEVITYLKAHNERRLTVAEILDGLKEEGISINRSTIYRNLDKLVENGDILAFKGKDNESAFYQYSGEHKECNEHLHLQCNSCGKIFHLEHGFVDDFMERLRKECKVELDVSKTMLVGTCEKCLAKD